MNLFISGYDYAEFFDRETTKIFLLEEKRKIQEELKEDRRKNTGRRQGETWKN